MAIHIWLEWEKQAARAELPGFLELELDQQKQIDGLNSDHYHQRMEFIREAIILSNDQDLQWRYRFVLRSLGEDKELYDSLEDYNDLKDVKTAIDEPDVPLARTKKRLLS